MRLLAVLALVLAAATACGGESEVVARVGAAEITEEQVEEAAELTREELVREGRDVGEEGTELAAIERQALARLVRAQRIELAAADLGVTVDEEEIRERLGEAEEQDEEEPAGERELIDGQVRTRLLLERVEARLAARLSITESELSTYVHDHADDFPALAGAEAEEALEGQLRQARQDELLQAWLRDEAGRIPVEYEESWKP